MTTKEFLHNYYRLVSVGDGGSHDSLVDCLCFDSVATDLKIRFQRSYVRGRGLIRVGAVCAGF